jgi:predicted anti-sigma-YlaC factor YlaD
MSDHVIDWLSPYLDGELKGGRLHRVEEHLGTCEACRAELESLQGLSALLQEAPAPEFTSNERFVAHVNLRLPKREGMKSRSRVIETGWWMIPVGLLAVWIFFSATILISDMVSAADRFGLLDGANALLISDSSDNAMWASTLGQFGMLEGDSLLWAETIESLIRNILTHFVWQVSIALLYLAWIAIWWARRTRQGQVPLLEG